MPTDDTKERPMFGCPLEEHLRLFKTDVAVVLKACCQALREQWMDTEGLFRIAAGTARVRLLKVGHQWFSKLRKPLLPTYVYSGTSYNGPSHQRTTSV